MVPPMRDAGTVSRTDHPHTDARPEAPDAVARRQDAASTGEAPDLTVGAVAAFAGVSVRTLHYWDTIGLVRPSQRSWSGYRLYSPADVTRLHQVLVYRETGLPLACIGELLDDPGTDALAHLRRQRDLLTEQLSRTMRMVRAVDTLIDRTLSTVGTSPRSGPLSPAEQAEILGTDWSPQYVAEAQERWGDTPEWAEATARQAAMTREDWEQVKARTLALEADLPDPAELARANGSWPLLQRLTVLRAVQEGLTNALRHGAGAAALRMEIARGRCTVLITNPVARSDRKETAGSGLAGLGERIRLTSGTMEAGPRELDGAPGFRLAVSLPVAAGGAPDASGTAESERQEDHREHH